jgi:hypothetical protein
MAAVAVAPVSNLGSYAVGTLGAVGGASTAGMLRRYIYDAELGEASVAAIRQIEARTST